MKTLKDFARDNPEADLDGFISVFKNADVMPGKAIVIGSITEFGLRVEPEGQGKKFWCKYYKKLTMIDGVYEGPDGLQRKTICVAEVSDNEKYPVPRTPETRKYVSSTDAKIEKVKNEEKTVIAPQIAGQKINMALSKIAGFTADGVKIWEYEFSASDGPTEEVPF